MKDITLADIKQVVHSTIRTEFADFEIKIDKKIDGKFAEFEGRIDKKFDDFEIQLDERFDEVLNAIGEEHEKFTVAIGEHTLELAGHNKRITRLEKVSA